MSELPPEEPIADEPTPVEPEPTPEPTPEPDPVPYAEDEPPRAEEPEPEPTEPVEPPAGGDMPCPVCGNHMIPTPTSPCTWTPPVPVEPPYEEVP